MKKVLYLLTYLSYLDIIKKDHNTKMIKKYCNKIYYIHLNNLTMFFLS